MRQVNVVSSTAVCQLGAKKIVQAPVELDLHVRVGPYSRH
jgi:hypothetical protein